MKKYLILAAAVFASVAFFACSTGDAGPTGPDGKNTATAVFQSGVSPSAAYAGCIDSFLHSPNTDTNNNANTILAVGRGGTPYIYRSVIKFDVSYIIPTNVTVKSAYLDLNASTTAGATTVNAYALTKDFLDDQVTWNSYTTGNLWTTAGGDYNATALGQPIIVTPLGPYRLTLTASVVQGWISDPSNNHGIILKATNETTGTNYVFFDTEEDVIAPKLTINYTLP